VSHSFAAGRATVCTQIVRAAVRFETWCPRTRLPVHSTRDFFDLPPRHQLDSGGTKLASPSSAISSGVGSRQFRRPPTTRFLQCAAAATRRIVAFFGERESFLRLMAIDAHVGIASLLLDAGDAPAALRAATRALEAGAQAPPGDPRRFGAWFVAARALWPEHPRWALRMASSARDGYREGGASPKMVERIDAWIAARHAASFE
jgi:hypothetical protein